MKNRHQTAIICGEGGIILGILERQSYPHGLHLLACGLWWTGNETHNCNGMMAHLRLDPSTFFLISKLHDHSLTNQPLFLYKNRLSKDWTQRARLYSRDRDAGTTFRACKSIALVERCRGADSPLFDRALKGSLENGPRLTILHRMGNSYQQCGGFSSKLWVPASSNSEMGFFKRLVQSLKVRLVQVERLPFSERSVV